MYPYEYGSEDGKPPDDRRPLGPRVSHAVGGTKQAIFLLELQSGCPIFDIPTLPACCETCERRPRQSVAGKVVRQPA